MIKIVRKFNILLGLLKPEKGEILCDGIHIMENYRGWLTQVSYIPQGIFLLDGTIYSKTFSTASSPKTFIPKSLPFGVTHDPVLFHI